MHQGSNQCFLHHTSLQEKIVNNKVKLARRYFLEPPPVSNVLLGIISGFPGSVGQIINYRTKDRNNAPNPKTIIVITLL